MKINCNETINENETYPSSQLWHFSVALSRWNQRIGHEFLFIKLTIVCLSFRSQTYKAAVYSCKFKVLLLHLNARPLL